ncbi:unnamed protein product [Adineta steineri]|uniref:Uncharacterized protein n=1 Tax=Adineta steineri TaxID=433720 RepID=A0A814CYT8_9BILA|nr:unnamed protein product [Adineta steineri]CAF0946509.1 unnamed protein product [Adineta steineri]CAF3482705.1 unnamed protein product [Adineta steineri]CAF3505940.1 unnamed protein product [Adineta steineri]
MNKKNFSPPLVDNRFAFRSSSIYQPVIEPSFNWNQFRRTELQFQKAEALHDSHVYDRCNCSMVNSSNGSPVCIAHGANEFIQTKIDETLLPTSSCPCAFCRKKFNERDRPHGLLTNEDLKQLFPLKDAYDINTPKTVTYLSRPNSAPIHKSFSLLNHTSAPRYIPTLKQSTRSNNIRKEINIQSAIPTNFGMRLDAEPNHNHSQMFDLPRERDAVFRSVEDYFHMTSPGRPTMIL